MINITTILVQIYYIKSKMAAARLTRLRTSPLPVLYDVSSDVSISGVSVTPCDSDSFWCTVKLRLTGSSGAS